MDIDGVTWQCGVPDREPSGRAVEVSSFTDRAAAERSVNENLAGNAAPIRDWLATARPTAAFGWEHGAVTGRHAPKWAEGSADLVDVTGSRVVLRRDPATPEGYHVHVAYPVPPRSVDGVDPLAPEWQEIAALFTGYLNQDVFDDHGSPEAAFVAFGQGWPQDDVMAVTDQAGRLLRQFPDEDDVRAAAEALGLEYHPPSAGQTYRAFLVDLQHHLWRSLP